MQRKAPCILCGIERVEELFSYNDSRCKRCNSKRVNDRTKALRWSAIKILGGDNPECSVCGCTLLLEIDHRNGGGDKERFSKSRIRYYKDIIEGKDSGLYRVLCGACNKSKVNAHQPSCRLSEELGTCRTK